MSTGHSSSSLWRHPALRSEIACRSPFTVHCWCHPRPSGMEACESERGPNKRPSASCLKTRWCWTLNRTSTEWYHKGIRFNKMPLYVHVLYNTWFMHLVKFLLSVRPSLSARVSTEKSARIQITNTTGLARNYRTLPVLPAVRVVRTPVVPYRFVFLSEFSLLSNVYACEHVCILFVPSRIAVSGESR